jgi:hypothetical protein
MKDRGSRRPLCPLLERLLRPALAHPIRPRVKPPVRASAETFEGFSVLDAVNQIRPPHAITRTAKVAQNEIGHRTQAGA